MSSYSSEKLCVRESNKIFEMYTEIDESKSEKFDKQNHSQVVDMK